MSTIRRRDFLAWTGMSIASACFPPSIRRALAIPASNRTGTIADVEHVVILMQENRSFDHYFGTLTGVRGFGDRMTIPLTDGRSVWEQRSNDGSTILPYHLDASVGNAQRVSGTPHGWTDAHLAWDAGRMGNWPTYKLPQSMGYYTEAEIPFQFALARAFTLCDAYHCAIHSSTNPNRLFMFTGTNDPSGAGGGPAIDNDHDDFGPPEQGYTWTTYPERLQAAGVDWKIYQDLGDYFSDNSLFGFRSVRDAFFDDPSSPLVQRGASTTLTDASLDGLRADVVAGRLPQVSWIVGPANYSEHPGPSSPVQGGYYTQQVLDALTADPDVWSRTVLFVCFDENDGFFDHVPPPCPPSQAFLGPVLGKSTVDYTADRHPSSWVYGPGPRVPMCVVSPWTRGGWICSQAFDHTSLVRFLEERFGVAEPNISPWRRAVLGDLTSAFNFTSPNDGALPPLPQFTRAAADAIRAAQEQLPQIPAPRGAQGRRPRQAPGVRPSRALPYALEVDAEVDVSTGALQLTFANVGSVGAVFHAYDRLALSIIPRRFTVTPNAVLTDVWHPQPGDVMGRYDVWVLGPNGFLRHFQGSADGGAALSTARPEILVRELGVRGDLRVTMHNGGHEPCRFVVQPNAYLERARWQFTVAPGDQAGRTWRLSASQRWYDFTVTSDGEHGFARRFAGRVENGKPSVTDPAMGLG